MKVVSSCRVLLGKIGRPHGMHGWNHCHDFGGLVDQFCPHLSVTVQFSPSSSDEASACLGCIEKIAVAGGRLLIKLATVKDRNAAHAYCGQYVLMPRTALKDVGEDEFYQHDLLGLSVYRLDGRLLGRVTSFIESAAHWILVVTPQEQKTATEYLIPFVSSHVFEVNIPYAKIVVEHA